jgi:hypothetical protein
MAKLQGGHYLQGILGMAIEELAKSPHNFLEIDLSGGDKAVAAQFSQIIGRLLQHMHSTLDRLPV